MTPTSPLLERLGNHIATELPRVLPSSHPFAHGHWSRNHMQNPQWQFFVKHIFVILLVYVYIISQVFPGHKKWINKVDFRVGFQFYTLSPECTLFSRHHCSPPIGQPASLSKICMPGTCERPLNWAIEPSNMQVISNQNQGHQLVPRIPHTYLPAQDIMCICIWTIWI